MKTRFTNFFVALQAYVLVSVFPIWPVFSFLVWLLLTGTFFLRWAKYAIFGIPTLRIPYVFGGFDIGGGVWWGYWSLINYEWLFGITLVVGVVSWIMSRNQSNLTNRSIGFGGFYGSTMLVWVLLLGRFAELGETQDLLAWLWIVVAIALAISLARLWAFLGFSFSTTHSLGNANIQGGYAIDKMNVQVFWTRLVNSASVVGLSTYIRRGLPKNADQIINGVLTSLLANITPETIEQVKGTGFREDFLTELRNQLPGEWGFLPGGMLVIEFKPEAEVEQLRTGIRQARDLADRVEAFRIRRNYAPDEAGHRRAMEEFTALNSALALPAAAHSLEDALRNVGSGTTSRD